MPPGKIVGSPNVAIEPTPPLNTRSFAMPNPRRVVDVITPVPSSTLSSLKMLTRRSSDREQRPIDLARQHDPVLERAVGARDAALEGDRTAQLRQEVRAGRVRLGALAHERDLEVGVGGE